MYELIILVTICQEPRGFLLETKDNIFAVPFSAEIIQQVKVNTSEQTEFSKIDLTKLAGVVCI